MPHPFIPVADTIEAALRFDINGVPAEFVFNFKWPTSVTTTIMQNLGTIIIDWVISSLAPVIPMIFTFNDVYLTDLSSVSAPAFSWQTGTSSNLPQSGGGSGTPVQNHTSLVISRRTANRGRSYRGRTYLSGLTEADLLNTNTWASATLSGFLAIYLALIANVGFAGFTDVVVSRHNGGSPRVVGVTTPVTAYSADSRITTQRRRNK